jgi:hypothetical protein
MTKRFVSDVDIDLGDRTLLLDKIQHVPAAMRDEKVRRHNSGIYATDIPYDSLNDVSALDYNAAEERGYVKIDLLNMWLYKHVRDEQHLISLMQEPKWDKLLDRTYCERLVHIGNHYDTMMKMEPVNSIARLAMFLSLIRPGKKHLIGRTWKEVGETIWTIEDSGYSFKRSHAVAYAHLVVVHMNLLEEDSTLSQHTLD